MRLLLFFVLFLFCPLAAQAERVLEVQGIQVEKRDGSGRDGAVIDATRQAATQAWTRLGHATPLPDLSPSQLQSLTSYLDIATESAQSSYYSATFNIGIRVSALSRLGGDSTTELSSEGAGTSNYSPPQQRQPGAVPQQPVSTEGAPHWVLVVPVREVAGVLQLWKAEDGWTQAWNRAGSSSGISTATASGDERDQQLLTAASLQGIDGQLADVLSQLASKYRAPAVALISLTSDSEPVQPNREVGIQVSYMEKDQMEVMSAESNLFVSQSLLPSVYPAAVLEAQRMILQLATGVPTVAQPGATAPTAALTPAGTPGLSASYGTSYSAPPAPVTTGSKLWVRIPLASPADLATYRQKINSIPGARFEVSALNRMYVEGNILYSGTQQQLMQELSTRGLRQQ